jgi:hypothetical protein
VGFGKYHYKIRKKERSSQRGATGSVGFHQEKQQFHFIFMWILLIKNELLQQLGTFKKLLSCILYQKLSDSNLGNTQEMIDNYN